MCRGGEVARCREAAPKGRGGVRRRSRRVGRSAELRRRRNTELERSRHVEGAQRAVRKAGAQSCRQNVGLEELLRVNA